MSVSDVLKSSSYHYDGSMAVCMWVCMCVCVCVYMSICKYPPLLFKSTATHASNSITTTTRTDVAARKIGEAVPKPGQGFMDFYHIVL